MILRVLWTNSRLLHSPVTSFTRKHPYPTVQLGIPELSWAFGVDMPTPLLSFLLEERERFLRLNVFSVSHKTKSGSGTTLLVLIGIIPWSDQSWFFFFPLLLLEQISAVMYFPTLSARVRPRNKHRREEDLDCPEASRHPGKLRWLTLGFRCIQRVFSKSTVSPSLFSTCFNHSNELIMFC